MNTFNKVLKVLKVLGIREKEEQGQGLILHLGKIKVVNTNAVFLTSS